MTKQRNMAVSVRVIHLLGEEELPRQLRHVLGMLAALDLFGGDWRKRHALGGDLVLEVRHDLASFLVAAHEGEPTRRLDQVEEAQHHHDCTEDAAENEHLAPAGDRAG